MGPGAATDVVVLELVVVVVVDDTEVDFSPLLGTGTVVAFVITVFVVIRDDEREV